MTKQERTRKINYLNQLYKAKGVINSYEIELTELKRFSKGIFNCIDNETNLQERIKELETNLNNLIKEYVATAKDIEEAIDTVTNNTYKAILRYRHINFMCFEDIAKRTGYSYKHIYYVYNKSLEKFVPNRT